MPAPEFDLITIRAGSGRVRAPRLGIGHDRIGDTRVMRDKVI